MIPEKYKLLSEDDSHFLVHDGEAEFKVARDGLSPELQEKIKSLGMGRADGADGAIPESKLTGKDLSTPKPAPVAPAAPVEQKKDELTPATPPVEEVPIWKSIVRTGLPIAGGIIGGIYGGPVGAAAGSTGGGMLGNAITANQGGELSKYRMLEDGEEFYRLDDGKGEFKVAKKGLSKAMQDRVVQHFAGGGVVEEAPAEAPPMTWLEQMNAQAEASRRFQDAEQARIYQTSAANMGKAWEGAKDAVGALIPEPSTQDAALRERMRASGMGVEPVAPVQPAAPVVPASAPAQIEVAQPPVAPQPPPVMPTDGGTGGGGMPSMPAAPRMPNTQAELRSAQSVGEQAIQAQLEAQQAAAQEEARIREAAAVQAEVRNKKFEEINAAHQARGDKLYNDVLTAKINPSQLWESRTTGQKIGSSIAIILSGIGQGLAGGPNMALGILDKAIDRDIDAQKENLRKNENALSQHMQMGRDMDSAQRLVKADARDAIAAQLELASAKFGDKKAVAGALAAVSAMRKQGALDRHEVASKETDLFLKKLAIGADYAKANAAAKEGNAELLVPGYGFALDPKAAVTAREATAAHGGLMNDLQELIAIRKKFGVEKAPTEARAQMESLQSSIMGSANQLYKFGALDKGSQAMLEQMMGDPTAFGNQQAKMEQFKKSVDRKLRGTLRAYMDPRSYKDPTALTKKLVQ